MISASRRSYRSDVTIRFGPAVTNGRILPVRASVDRSFKSITPEGKPVRRVFMDDDKKVWDDKQLGKARVGEEGELIPVNMEELAKAKAPTLPENVITLNAFPIDQVEQYLFPSDDNSYVFEPVKLKKGVILPDDPANVAWYDFIYSALTDNEVALIGMMNLNKNEGLFRLGTYQQNLVLSRQLWPEDLNQFDPYAARERNNESEGFKKKAAAAVAKLTKDFDPSMFVDTKRQRLDALQSSSDLGIAGTPIDQTLEEFDIMAALDAFEA